MIPRQGSTSLGSIFTLQGLFGLYDGLELGERFDAVSRGLSKGRHGGRLDDARDRNILPMIAVAFRYNNLQPGKARGRRAIPFLELP